MSCNFLPLPTVAKSSMWQSSWIQLCKLRHARKLILFCVKTIRFFSFEMWSPLSKVMFSLLLFTTRWSTFKLPFRCLLPLSCFYWSSQWLFKVKITLVSFKLVNAIFIKFLFFHQMIALQKLRKMLFISSNKLLSLSRYSIFRISVLPPF